MLQRPSLHHSTARHGQIGPLPVSFQAPVVSFQAPVALMDLSARGAFDGGFQGRAHSPEARLHKAPPSVSTGSAGQQTYSTFHPPPHQPTKGKGE